MLKQDEGQGLGGDAPCATDVAYFIMQVRQNPFNAAILDRMAPLSLPQCMLVGGCLFQTIWNLQSGRAPFDAIKDYDLFYFDDGDLTQEGEDAVNEQLRHYFADLDIQIDAANQARVHLWYESHFGYPLAPLTSSRDGVDRFLMPCTAVGIGLDASDEPMLYAPFGLEDLYRGRVRPNPRLQQADLFARKATSYQARWPWLSIAQACPVSS